MGFDLGPSLELRNGRLVSTDLILGHFAPGVTNPVVIIFDKKKMLDPGVASGDARARQVRLPFCLLLFLCCEEDRGEHGVCNMYVKDFEITAQPGEVDQW